MRGGEPSERQTWNIEECEPILDKLSGALDRGGYGVGTGRDWVQQCRDEGSGDVAASRKVTAGVMVLGKRAGRVSGGVGGVGGWGAGGLVRGEGDTAGDPGPGAPGAGGADGAAGSAGADGADGAAGEPGAQGEPGPAGPQGPAGEQGPSGPAGAAGARGSDGAVGADGVDFFDIFIDDFFTIPGNPDGQLPVGLVKITEPALGVPAIDVKTGDEVNEGDVLLVIEAMKMENEITAPVSGTIKEIDVSAGARVSDGDTLLVIEPAGD